MFGRKFDSETVGHLEREKKIKISIQLPNFLYLKPTGVFSIMPRQFITASKGPLASNPRTNVRLFAGMNAEMSCRTSKTISDLLAIN